MIGPEYHANQPTDRDGGISRSTVWLTEMPLAAAALRDGSGKCRPIDLDVGQNARGRSVPVRGKETVMTL
jgi:hypothetical protein